MITSKELLKETHVLVDLSYIYAQNHLATGDKDFLGYQEKIEKCKRFCNHLWSEGQKWMEGYQTLRGNLIKSETANKELKLLITNKDEIIQSQTAEIERLNKILEGIEDFKTDNH